MTGPANDMSDAKSDRGPLFSHTYRYTAIGLSVGNGLRSAAGGKAGVDRAMIGKVRPRSGH
jgi:hypothetical protein